MPRVVNLGLARGILAAPGLQVVGGRLTFAVAESWQADTDLNGDGDAFDHVPHVFDMAGGGTTNTGLGLAPHDNLLVSDKAAVARFFEGGVVDLNGDGDHNDSVVVVHDFRSGSTRFLGLAGTGIQVDGPIVTFVVNEQEQGATDLNGDGDAIDGVAFLYDVRTDVATNLGLAAAPELSGGLVAMAVSEGAQAGTDLNADGDATDFVLHVHDVSTGVTRNLGEALVRFMHLAIDPERVAFLVSEASQGDADLNGDGDAFDHVLHMYDRGSQLTSNFIVSVTSGVLPLTLSGGLMPFLASEAFQGEDLNGDGDLTDSVYHVLDARAGVVVNQGLAARLFSGYYYFDPQNRTGVFAVDEQNQGADLNGDGDQNDQVVHLFTAASRRTTNLGFAGGAHEPSSTLLMVGVGEASQGGLDLNGDGDATDLVLHVYDLAAGTTVNVGRAFGSNSQVAVGRRFIAWRVPELAQGGADLNGDGDATDDIVHVYDHRTGSIRNLGLAVQTQLSGALVYNQDVVAFTVIESLQGAADLNGDGDALDAVLFIHYLRHGATLSTSLAIETTAVTSRVDLLMEGSVIVASVLESHQGGSDLNGDGDATDSVVHVVDVDP